MFIILLLILKIKFLGPIKKNLVEKSFVAKVFEEKWLTCIIIENVYGSTVLNIKVRSKKKLLDLM